MPISTWEPSELDKWKQRAEQAEAALDTCRTDRNEWRMRYERTDELRTMYLAEKKQAEATIEQLRVALIVIQSTTPGSAHRIAIQALEED